MNTQTHQNKRSFSEFSNLFLSGMLDVSDSTSFSNTTSSNTSHIVNNTFDDSLEPIAIVTPPKKRAHIDTEAPYSYQADLSLNYFHHPNHHQQRRNSFLQDFTPRQQRRNSVLEFLQSSSLGPFDPLPYSSFSHSNVGSTMPPLMNPSLMNKPMDTPMSFMSNFASTSNNFLEPNSLSRSGIAANGFLDPLSIDMSNDCRRHSLTFESFELNDRDNHTSCPDLCESSSSLPDVGNFIIQTCDSFKENNYAKAEIIPAGDFATLNRLTNPSSGCVSKTNLDEAGARVTPTKKNDTASARFKPFHEEKWSYHFNELLQFKRETGHCLVPHTFPAKPHLARWVKRQRRQYKLKLEGNKNSTMTDERIKILNDVGFVWDSHEIIWNERFNQLKAYKDKYGNCKVPSYCKECPQLASWVKCQRRQYKLYWEDGKGSSMTDERIKLLNSIGFIWEVHPSRKTNLGEQ